MVDGDPDIDAIHRLIFKKPPTFVHNEPLLGKKTYVLLIRKIRYGDAKAYFRYFIYRLPSASVLLTSSEVTLHN